MEALAPHRLQVHMLRSTSRCRKCLPTRRLPRALKWAVAAVSIGIVAGEEMLDLCYEEDSNAEVHFNVVMTAEGKFIEVQGTAEGEPFDRQAMDRLLNLTCDGISNLIQYRSSTQSHQVKVM